MSASLPSPVEQELRAYQAARSSRDTLRAWRALEDAHILSQSSLGPHLRVHAAMLGYAVALRNWREASGQIARLALAPLGSLTGRLPWGNTGRASVSAFRPMPVSDDLRAKLSAAGHFQRGTGMTVTIYHNPACGTSRNTLAMIRATGTEPVVIEYLKSPPTREELADLIARMGVPVRDVMRRKGTPYEELGLDDPSLTDDQLLDAMLAHPILINRPIVVTPKGARLARPSEMVLAILDQPLTQDFTKEDGEVVPAQRP